MTTKGDCLCSTSLEDKLQIFLLLVSYLGECSSVIRRAINPRTEEEWEKKVWIAISVAKINPSAAIGEYSHRCDNDNAREWSCDIWAVIS